MLLGLFKSVSKCVSNSVKINVSSVNYIFSKKIHSPHIKHFFFLKKLNVTNSKKYKFESYKELKDHKILEFRGGKTLMKITRLKIEY